jgi:hypothetical protein
MFKIKSKDILVILAFFLITEFLSFAGFFWPELNLTLFIVLTITLVGVTLYRLEFGVLIVLAELFIGSLGHLFYLNIGPGQLSIRMAFWLILMAIFSVRLIYQLIKDKSRAAYWQALKNFRGKKLFGLLSFFILISLVNGLLRGHAPATIFSDFNAWLYLFLLGPLAVVYGAGEAGRVKRLLTLFTAAAIWLSLKTLFLLFIFTHNLSMASDLYLWLRKTLVGEMTPTKTGWPRIFIQGQIYSAIAFFAVFWLQSAGLKFREFFKRPNIGALLIAAWFFSAVLISFSRSFWVALVSVLFISLLFIWRQASFKKMLTAGIWLIISGLLSFLMIYLVVAFPYIHLPSADFSSNFLERVSSGSEAALASRWSLLPVLLKEIGKEPLLGQGYGATVTYFSRDPRILQNNPSGQYTTYAFEWGYLDLWLKLGLLGLVTYLFILGKLIFDGWRQGNMKSDSLLIILAGGLLFLVFTHMFTPYLNHPLGLGFLLLSSCLIWPNKVY